MQNRALLLALGLAIASLAASATPAAADHDDPCGGTLDRTCSQCDTWRDGECVHTYTCLVFVEGGCWARA